MYHNFIIHSSVDGHLGYFHVLAIVNSAAVNTGVHVSFSIYSFLRYMASSGTTLRMGEKNSKQNNCLGINLQNIQAAHSAQYQKNNNPIKN